MGPEGCLVCRNTCMDHVYTCRDVHTSNGNSPVHGPVQSPESRFYGVPNVYSMMVCIIEKNLGNCFCRSLQPVKLFNLGLYIIDDKSICTICLLHCKAVRCKYIFANSSVL